MWIFFKCSFLKLSLNLDILLSPKYLSDTAMCYTYTVLLRDSRKRGEIEGTIKAAATYSHVWFICWQVSLVTESAVSQVFFS